MGDAFVESVSDAPGQAKPTSTAVEISDPPATAPTPAPVAAPAPAPAKAPVTSPPTKQASRLSLNLDKMAEGEHKLGEADFLTTARAQNEVAITVRGDPRWKAKRILQLKNDVIGKDKVKAAWRPNHNQVAVASEKDGNCLLNLYSRQSMPKPLVVHNLGPGRPAWIDWDCTGATLALMQEGVGIDLWDVPSEPNASAPTQPLRLAPTITIATSFCAWSKKFQQLAIGTNAGKVIIFNKPQGVMQLHDRKGKHGAAVTCGDWLVDNRLGLASGTRVKISKPLPEHGAQWESYSKFKLSGMLSRVPRKFKDAGAPKLLAFSLSYPPFVAVCIGENYMLVFGTTGAGNNEDVGLTFPDDYGERTKQRQAHTRIHCTFLSARDSTHTHTLHIPPPHSPIAPLAFVCVCVHRPDHRLPVAGGRCRLSLSGKRFCDFRRLWRDGKDEAITWVAGGSEGDRDDEGLQRVLNVPHVQPSKQADCGSGRPWREGDSQGWYGVGGTDRSYIGVRAIDWQLH